MHLQLTTVLCMHHNISMHQESSLKPYSNHFKISISAFVGRNLEIVKLEISSVVTNAF